MMFVEIFDNIMQKYEDISGNNGYSQTLDKANIDTSNKARLSGIIASYYILRLNKQKGIEELKRWGINVTGNNISELKKVENIIKRIKTNLKISNLKNEITGKEKITYEQVIVNIENALNRNIDGDNLTVSKWVALIKSIEKKNELIKNHGRNY